MEGKGRLGVLGVESPDPTLSLLASLGLGIASGTALVVDLIGDVRTARTLADVVEEGPTLLELSPGHTGVGIIAGGGVETSQAVTVVESFASNWPAVVVRCARGDWPGPVVPVRALFPGLLAETDSHPAVWQPLGSRVRPPGPGPILPRLSSGMARSLLAGRVPIRRRWIAAWERVWEMPWA